MGTGDGSGGFDADRFLTAQDEGGTFDRALDELRAGRKRTHWMWFVFPQIAGLGTSATSRWFALGSRDDAVAYLRHPVLGTRLRAATDALLDLHDDAGTAGDILGTVDALKLRSSMTLFACADPDDPRFVDVLDRYYSGERDPRTERLIGPTGSGHVD